jgi:hypothetical protein
VPACSGRTVIGLNIQPLREITFPALTVSFESLQLRVCHRCVLCQGPELSRMLRFDILQRPVAHIDGRLRVQGRESELGVACMRRNFRIVRRDSRTLHFDDVAM